MGFLVTELEAVHPPKEHGQGNTQQMQELDHMSLLGDGKSLPLEVHLIRVIAWLVEFCECTLDSHSQKKTPNKPKPQTPYTLLEISLCKPVKKRNKTQRPSGRENAFLLNTGQQTQGRLTIF